MKSALIPAAPAAVIALLAALSVTPAQAFGVPPSLGSCLEAEDEDAALRICRQIATSAGSSEETMAAAAIRASQILRARGAHDEALDILWPRQSVPEINVEFGNVYFEDGIMVLADFHFEEALRQGYDPDPEMRARMVSAAYLYGEEMQFGEPPLFESAIVSYDRALALDPGHLNSLLGRGGAYLALAQHEAATADLDRAIALGADWSGYLMRARARLALGDEAGAVADLRRVLEDNPGHAGARETLAGLGARP